MGLYRWSHLMLVMPLFLLINFFHAPLIASENGKSDEEKMAIVLKLYREYQKDFPGAMDISAAEARTLFEGGKVVFIDAREPEEQAVSALPGAITEEMFLKNPGIAQGKTAVAYCTIGYRSGVFSEKMGSRGIDVVNLTGGIVAWVLDGGKVYLNGQETSRVHVYGEEWNYLPEGYEAIMFGFLEKLLN